MKQDVIYITGHQHPDTDSIAAAIGYAFFKRANGVKAIPCRLGKIGTETKYLLDRFGFPEPMLLEDARVKMSEIEIDEPTTVMPDKTIYEAIQLMHGAGKQTCAVVDEADRVVGMLTMNDIALVAMGDTAETEKLLEDVSPENINTAISGRIIYRAPDRHIRGRVSVVAITKEDIAIHDIKDKIVVAGDDPEAQKHIIEMGAGLLILVRTENVSEEVVETAKKYGCTVIISGHSTMNTSRYAYFAPPISKIMATKIVKFYANELAEDVGVKMMRTRYHAYPIVDENDKIVGCASRYHIMNSRNKKIILVDHNEFSQSVRAIDKAEVLEVIDHHRINDFSTKRPVAFRNEIIGSTATIVATMFRENQIPIPQNLAGLLLGAILSDTLMFRSPTCTEIDRSAALALAEIADVKVEELASAMFEAGSDFSNKTENEILNQDFKIFHAGAVSFGVAQISAMSRAELDKVQKRIEPYLEQMMGEKQIQMIFIMLTDILNESTFLVYRGADSAQIAASAFNCEVNEKGIMLKGVVSRKKQLIPNLINTLAEKG